MDPARRNILIPKRSLIQRYPRAFQFIVVSTGLLILFSKPIYDAFIRTDRKPPPDGKARPW